MDIKIVNTQQQREDAYFVRKTVFVDEQQVPIELEMDEFEEEATHFVVYDKEMPIAAGRLRFLENFAKVERICVLKSYRKSGVGHKLMLFIEQFAIEQGANKLKLHAQTRVENFYKKLGYHTVSEPFMDAGIAHVAMIKEMKQ